MVGARYSCNALKGKDGVGGKLTIARAETRRTGPIYLIDCSVHTTCSYEDK